MVKKNNKKNNKKNKKKEKNDIGNWSQIERYALTEEVIPKLQELGLGIYQDEINKLEKIINNFVHEGIECDMNIDLTGSNRYLEIKLFKSKMIRPLICLRNQKI